MNQHDQMRDLLKEARKIIRASSSRHLAKDWDARATQALSHVNETPKNEHDSGDLLRKAGNLDVMREAFEKFRDQRNKELEKEGHKPGSKFHVTNAHYATWQAAQQALAAKPFNFTESMRQTLERFDHLPEGSKADYQRAKQAAEPAPLVRLTHAELRNLADLYGIDLGRAVMGNFIGAIMDAMEEKNK